MPGGHGVRVDDHQATRPHGPRTSKGDPESPIRVFERWARALFLQRRHLLPQSKIFDDEVGAAPTHRANGTGAERDEEDNNADHSGGVCLSRGVIFKREIRSLAEARTTRKSLISLADEF